MQTNITLTYYTVDNTHIPSTHHSHTHYITLIKTLCNTYIYTPRQHLCSHYTILIDKLHKNFTHTRKHSDTHFTRLVLTMDTTRHSYTHSPTLIYMIYTLDNTHIYTRGGGAIN